MKKTALITGASRGIGACLAERFAQEGYQVMLGYHRSEEKARLVRQKIRSAGGSAEVFCADLGDPAQARRIGGHCVRVFGGVDVLINNAAIAQSKQFQDITAGDWDRMMQVNLRGAYLCAQSVLDHMLGKKSGHIINISSIWGMTGASCEVHYCAAKAGLIGMTKALAKELAPSGIHVNCIAPGIIQTDMLEDFTPEELETLRAQTPMGRLGTPGDIAECALYLAGSAFMTGQVLSPNGGFLI